jgi:hypothetical protein
MSSNNRSWIRRDWPHNWGALLGFLASAVIFALLLAWASTAHCTDPWSKADMALEATYQVLHWVDCGQTQMIVRNPDRYWETNPVLGRHPNSESVYLYFAATSALHVLVAHFLPEQYRPYWQCVTIGIQGATVGRNFRVGLQVRF